MGGGDADHKKEHLLLILPFPEPKETIEHLAKKYPNYEITYKEVGLTDSSWKNEEQVPDG